MNKAENTNRITLIVQLSASIAVAALYFTTMAPSLDKIDSGELAAVQGTAGVAHPTGYPLFTLIGWLFSRIPLGSTIWQLNLLSLLFVAGGVFLFMRASLLLLQIVATPAAPKKQVKGTVKPVALLPPSGFFAKYGSLAASVLGGWFLAFSKTVWETSTSIEVYSLHIFLLGLLFLTILRAFHSTSEKTRPWIWVAVALALAFSNHLTTIVILPGLAWIYFVKAGINAKAFQTLGLMLAAFCPIVILMYLWLPLRSATGPAMNWGSTDGWDFFWYHVSGKQFRIWWFTGQKAFNEKFHDFFMGGKFMAGIGKQFAWGGFILGLAGVVVNFIRNKKIAIFFLLLFLTTVLYVSNYSIPDLAPYFLMAYFCIAFWAVICLGYLFSQPRVSTPLKYGLTGFAFLLTLVPIALHHSELNKKDLWMYEDYTRTALESLPPNAMVITYQWDHFVSGAYYLQQVEKVRPDVLLVEYEIMRNRLWYYDHLKRHAPELMEEVKPQAEAFFGALKPFYFDGDESVFQELSRSYPALFWALISSGREKRPVYIGPEVLWERINNPKTKQIELAPGDTVVPGAYFYQVLPKSEARRYVDIAPRDKPIRMDAYEKNEEYYTGRLRWYLMVVAHDRALYELMMGKPDRARQWREEVRRISPESKLHPSLEAL